MAQKKNPFGENFRRNINIGGKDGTEMEDFRKLGMGLQGQIDELISPMGELSYFNTTGTAIAIATVSDGSTNMVLCNPTCTLENHRLFDMPANGRLRYIGGHCKMFHVASTISFAAEEANDVFVIGLAKNGTVLPTSKCLTKILNANDTASTALHVMVELCKDDYLELYVGNITDAGDFTLKTFNVFAMGMK